MVRLLIDADALTVRPCIADVDIMLKICCTADLCARTRRKVVQRDQTNESQAMYSDRRAFLARSTAPGAFDNAYTVGSS